MDEDIRIPTENKELEQEFFNFFREVITNVFCFENEEFQEEVNSVPRAVHMDKLKNKLKTRPWMEFSQKHVRCAYLLRYGVLNSVTLVEHLQKVQESDSTFFNRLLSASIVRICCFGGGAGSELVTIAKVINNILKAKSEIENPERLQLRFCILDKCEGWEEWIIPLTKMLRKCSTIHDKSKVDIRVRFKQVNLIEPWSEDVLKVIQKCDILTMVKFVSTLDLSEDEYELKKDLRLLKDIAQYVKLDAKIFFLDYAGGGYCHMVEKNMKKFQYIEKLHSHLHQSHVIDIMLWSEELRSHNSFVNRMMLGRSVTTVSSAVWVKIIPKVKSKKKKTVKALKKKQESQNYPDAIKYRDSQPSKVVLDEFEEKFLDENLLKNK